MPIPSVLEHLRNLAVSTENTDVTLVAKLDDSSSQEFPSHISMLSRSDVFASMFASSFVEGASKRVEIPVRKAIHVELLKEFLYTDKMTLSNELTAFDIADVWALCDQYNATAAFDMLLDSVLDKLRKLALPDGHEVVSHLAQAVLREDVIRKAAQVVLSKVALGDGSVLRSLLWLRRLQHRTGFSMSAEATACLEKVMLTNDVGNFSKEMTLTLEGHSEVDILRMQQLITGKFMQRISQAMPISLDTVCSNTYTAYNIHSGRTLTKSCGARKCHSINASEKVLLEAAGKAVIQRAGDLFSNPVQASDEPAEKKQRME